MEESINWDFLTGFSSGCMAIYFILMLNKEEGIKQNVGENIIKYFFRSRLLTLFGTTFLTICAFYIGIFLLPYLWLTRDEMLKHRDN